MRQFVDDMLAGGITVTVAADVAHRRSPILPLVLAGVADAVLPAGWTELARRAGADVLAIDPASHLRVALVHRRARSPRPPPLSPLPPQPTRSNTHPHRTGLRPTPSSPGVRVTSPRWRPT